MSLLRSDVSLDPSVAAKMNADLLSGGFSDEAGDDEVFIATDGDAHEWQMQSGRRNGTEVFVELEKSKLAMQNEFLRIGIFQHIGVVYLASVDWTAQGVVIGVENWDHQKSSRVVERAAVRGLRYHRFGRSFSE